MSFFFVGHEPDNSRRQTPRIQRMLMQKNRWHVGRATCCCITLASMLD